MLAGTNKSTPSTSPRTRGVSKGVGAGEHELQKTTNPIYQFQHQALRRANSGGNTTTRSAATAATTKQLSRPRSSSALSMLGSSVSQKRSTRGLPQDPPRSSYSKDHQHTNGAANAECMQDKQQQQEQQQDETSSRVKQLERQCTSLLAILQQHGLGHLAEAVLTTDPFQHIPTRSQNSCLYSSSGNLPQKSEEVQILQDDHKTQEGNHRTDTNRGNGNYASVKDKDMDPDQRCKQNSTKKKEKRKKKKKLMGLEEGKPFSRSLAASITKGEKEEEEEDGQDRQEPLKRKEREKEQKELQALGELLPCDKQQGETTTASSTTNSRRRKTLGSITSFYNIATIRRRVHYQDTTTTKEELIIAQPKDTREHDQKLREQKLMQQVSTLEENLQQMARQCEILQVEKQKLTQRIDELILNQTHKNDQRNEQQHHKKVKTRVSFFEALAQKAAKPPPPPPSAQPPPAAAARPKNRPAS